MPGRAAPAHEPTRWLFGDQLGPPFLDDHDGPVLLVVSRRVFAREAFHRHKAHLVLSAMRLRAAELGNRCRYARVDRYRDALAEVDGRLQVLQPTSRAAVALSQHADLGLMATKPYVSGGAYLNRMTDHCGGCRFDPGMRLWARMRAPSRPATGGTYAATVSVWRATSG